MDFIYLVVSDQLWFLSLFESVLLSRKLFCLIYPVYWHKAFSDRIILCFKISNKSTILSLLFLSYFSVSSLLDQSCKIFLCYSSQAANIEYFNPLYLYFLFSLFLLIYFIILCICLLSYFCFFIPLITEVGCSANFQLSFLI